MEGRCAVALLLVVLAAAASSLVALLERRQQLDDGKPFSVVRLRGKDGKPLPVSLALMKHDLSMAGFTNRSHHWHVFRGYESLIPGSTPLPFANTYRDLIGGLANLPNLPLGPAASTQAAHAMSSYNPGGAADDGDLVVVEAALKLALATMAVTATEARRLKPIRDVLLGCSAGGEVRVAVEHLPYIEHWDTICFEILRARRTGKWDGPFTQLLRERADIISKEEALSVVWAIGNRTMADLLMAHTRSA